MEALSIVDCRTLDARAVNQLLRPRWIGISKFRLAAR